MKTRHVFLGLALATTALSLTAADATILITFGQTGGGTPISGVNNGAGVTTVTGTAIPVSITEIAAPGLIPPDIDASFSFHATSIGAASSPFLGFVTQPFSGTFSITSGANNYLSGTFTDAIFGAGPSLTLSTASTPPELLSFSSNVINNTLFMTDRAFSLSFAGVTPIAAIVGGSLRSFDSSVSGDASGTVPEPSTWAMMLLGFAGLAYAGLRRGRKAHLAL
jgi:hypothetical protein